MIPMIPYTVLTIQTSNTYVAVIFVLLTEMLRFLVFIFSTCNWIKPEYNSLNELFIDVPIYIVLIVS